MNGAVTKFHSFGGREPVEEGGVVDPSNYCLLLEVPSKYGIHIDGLPPNVVSIESTPYTYNSRGKHVSLQQFPVVLAYAITDYKCQGQTYDFIVMDPKKPRGFAQPASLYVQLSRVRTINALSILRPFSEEELRAPLSEGLKRELAWQEQMDRSTREKYGD